MAVLNTARESVNEYSTHQVGIKLIFTTYEPTYVDKLSRFYIRWKLILFVLPLVFVAAGLVTRDWSLTLSAVFILAATASVAYLFTNYVSDAL